MPGSVGNVSNEPKKIFFRNILLFGKCFEDSTRKIEICFFARSAEKIDLCRLTLPDDFKDPFAMIIDIDPIPDLQAVTKNRNTFAAKSFGDNCRNKFFRELICAVIIRATGYADIISPGM